MMRKMVGWSSAIIVFTAAIIAALYAAEVWPVVAVLRLRELDVQMG